VRARRRRREPLKQPQRGAAPAPLPPPRPRPCRPHARAPAAPTPAPAPQGVGSHIKLKAAGELQPSGKREVFFEANGVPRVVEVADKRSAEGLAKKAVREKVGWPALGGRGWAGRRSVERAGGKGRRAAPAALAGRSVAVRGGRGTPGGGAALPLSPPYAHPVPAFGTHNRTPRPQADSSVLGSVGAPMAGAITEVSVKPGQAVAAGQVLVVMSAMKMETAVAAPCAGVVTQVRARLGAGLPAGPQRARWLGLSFSFETSSLLTPFHFMLFGRRTPISTSLHTHSIG
jgi:hypothetical protein